MTRAELRVTCAFDGGNGHAVGVDSPDDVRVRLHKDAGDEFLQWFYFRVCGVRDLPLTVKIVNANEATYPRGYVDYRAVGSADAESWVRLETRLHEGILEIRHRSVHDQLYIAYFAPYPLERHRRLIGRAVASSRARLEVLGRTLDGRDIDLLRLGDGQCPIWVIARQHPGETMAAHWMEGFVERLLDPDDPVVARLLEHASLFVVPNMNPDGSFRGYLRTNASGANLNREWLEPSLARSPEVFVVREKMHETGVGVCLDVHGDEELPHNFIAGPEGVPSFSAWQRAALTEFRDALCRLSRDFQVVHGYPVAAPGAANLTLCTNYVAETFGALAMTLEQPFKDSADRPDARFGWSPPRCRALARACIDALWASRASWLSARAKVD